MPAKASALKYKKKILELLNEDEANSSFLAEEIERLDKPRQQSTFCSRILELFVHLRVDEDTARTHWDNIFINHAGLTKSLERDIGLRMAAFDYFMNLNRCLENPILVEIRLFRTAEQQAVVDGLTGLYNRRYFDEHIEKELNRAERHEKRMSLLVVDIDDFKRYNDTKGHLFGDEVIRKLSKRLRSSMRKEDVACRYGGDEFVVIMPETSEDGALSLAMRFKRRVERDAFLKSNGVTISGGIATFPLDGNTAEELLHRADKSLYKAKFLGKDTIVRESTRAARKRRYKRHWQIAFQPLVETFAQQRFVKMVSQDVSVGGVKLESDVEYALNTKVLMQVQLPKGEIMFVVGKIVWAKQVDNITYSYGVEFYDLNRDQISKLKKVLPSNYNIPEF
jgi:diguanylate cyclase (GGDEF)-like protein